ncbi:MAG: VOC family protein [Promethearchaeota archaeon]|jgi:predicted enzyme related to lactoylglutathione lyase
MFKGFITFLGTEDLEKTSQFYQNVLGLTVYLDQDVCRIFNITNQSKIGFCKHIPVIHGEKSPILTLVTEEVEEIYEKITNSGVNVPEKPKFNPKFNIYHFFFKDPNGYTIEVQKFLYP